MREEIEAMIISDSYVCNAGYWTTDYHVEAQGDIDFEDIKKRFLGKKVRITIEEIE